MLFLCKAQKKIDRTFTNPCNFYILWYNLPNLIISEVEIHASSVRMAGELPRNEKNVFYSYDMVSHPLLQMSTSHIVVKRKPLLFTWALLLFNITA